jgi:hypothetical protein
MKRPNYTPAPWVHKGLAIWRDEIIIAVLRSKEHPVSPHSFAPSLTETKANAHLIAGAPRMYEAIEKLLTTLEDRAIKYEDFTDLIVAYKIARGEKLL